MKNSIRHFENRYQAEKSRTTHLYGFYGEYLSAKSRFIKNIKPIVGAGAMAALINGNRYQKLCIIDKGTY